MVLCVTCCEQSNETSSIIQRGQMLTPATTAPQVGPYANNLRRTPHFPISCASTPFLVSKSSLFSYAFQTGVIILKGGFLDNSV